MLQDYTPGEISPNSITVNPNGPFFIICGTSRTPSLIDTRPDDEKEKINFTLKDGSGYFATMDQPDVKHNGILSIIPDSDGFVKILFYPKSDFFSHTNDYLINVSVTGGKYIRLIIL